MFRVNNRTLIVLHKLFWAKMFLSEWWLWLSHGYVTARIQQSQTSLLTSLDRVQHLLGFKAKVGIFWPVLVVLISLIGYFLFKEFSWRPCRWNVKQQLQSALVFPSTRVEFLLSITASTYNTIIPASAFDKNFTLNKIVKSIISSHWDFF